MSDYSFRPFEPDDVPAITAIYRPYVTDTVISFELEAPDEAEMASRFARLAELGHPVVIVERGGEVIGYAYASFYRVRPAYRFTCENSIYLRQDAVGRGIGGSLLRELMAQSKAHGFTQMIAVITAERANSLRLHEKAGFRLVGRHEAIGYKFGRWLDVVHMQKAL